MSGEGGGGAGAAPGDDRRAPLWRALRWAGSALALAGLAWVAVPLARSVASLPAQVDLHRLLVAVAGAALAYALLCVLMVAAWWWLLGAYGRRPRFAAGYAVWARSQVAKYLPGNVFHYVGRQLLGARIGLGQGAVAAAGVLELVSMLAAAAVLLALETVGGWTAGRGGAVGRTLLLAAVAVVAVVLADLGLRRLVAVVPRLAGALPAMPARRRLLALAPATAVHGVVLLGNGALLYALLIAGWGGGAGFGKVAATYLVAWAAGTVTVGAPAGLGVREAVITLELSPALGAEAAAALAVAFRLATVAGDLLTAAAGWRVGLGDEGMGGERR